MKEGIFMKSRWKQMCIFLVLLLGMTGCGQKETEPKSEQAQTEGTKEEGAQETEQEGRTDSAGRARAGKPVAAENKNLFWK